MSRTEAAALPSVSPGVPGIQPARRKGPSRLPTLLLGLPALVFLAVFYFIPVALLFSQSVEQGGVEHFRKAVGDDLYVRVLLDTLLIAAYTTVLSLLLGYGVAYVMATTNSKRAGLLILILVLLPFWTSVLVRTYGWMVILGRNGVVNRLLMSAGIIDSPLALINNMLGVVIGMVHVLLPYMIFPLVAVMKRIDPSLVPAAVGLGASPFAAFLRIYLPLSMPGVIAGATLVFVLAVGFYITPALLGGGKVAMMAVLIEQQVRSFLNWPLAAALSVVLLLATLGVFAAVKAVANRTMRWQ